MAGIIWLASYPKSGNTWARLVFETLLGGGDSPVDINSRKKFCRSDSSRTQWLRRFGPGIDEMEISAIFKARHDMQAYYTNQSEGGVMLKTHCAHARLDGSSLIEPERTAAAIYILRNPLDVVISSANFWNLSTLEAIRRMAKTDNLAMRDDANVYGFLSSWSNHVLSWTRYPHPGLLVVRYEDMLENPVDTFGAMARHVGLSPGHDELERAVQYSSFKALRKQEAESGFAEAIGGRSFFRKGVAGQWREELKERHVRRIVRDHGAVMARHGYLPDGSEDIPPLPTLSEDLFPSFECGLPIVPPGAFYESVGSVGFDIRL